MLRPTTPPELTLGYGVAEWIEGNCAIPDGDSAGNPFKLTGEQLRFILWFYAIDSEGNFQFRRGMMVRPQKWGKGPLSAALICAEAAGPTVFDGFDAAGEPVGRPWATPWIQVVAVSEDQTDNVWTALLPMIELGSLKADMPDTGKTRINVEGGGVIEPVTSAAISRLGQRLTFAVHDETHSWTQRNGGTKLADTQRRNLAGMSGRSLETTNAWDPSENSVAQLTYEQNMDDVLVDYPEPVTGSFKNARNRGKILKKAYKGAPWVDLERIEAECQELLPRDPNQAERFFGNRIVAGADKAFDLEAFKTRESDEPIAPGRKITVGFDGSRRLDTTGLVLTDVESGLQMVHSVWHRPPTAGEEWEVPIREVNEAVADIFENWDVVRFYGDPPYYETEMDTWAGLYGDKRVIRWYTNRYKAMAYAIKAWVTDWTASGSDYSWYDAHELLAVHVGNATRRPTKMRDDDGSFLWVVGKDGANSPNKIDLVVAAVLSWSARGDAIKTGELNRRRYSTASW